MDNGQDAADGRSTPVLFSPAAAKRDQKAGAVHDCERTWRPSSGPGAWVGGAGAAAAFALTCTAAYIARSATGAGTVFWLVATAGGCLATAILIAHLYRLRSLRYTLSHTVVIVAAPGLRVVLPYRAISEVVYRPRDIIHVEGYERFWPGYYDSSVLTSDGRWRSVATSSPRERVRIRTVSGGAVAISPERPILFVEALEALRRGAAIPVAVLPLVEESSPERVGSFPTIAAPPDSPGAMSDREVELAASPAQHQPVALRIFRERIVRGDPVASNFLAIGLIILIALVFIAAWKADSVTRPLALRWNPDGEPIWYVRPDGFWLIDGVWMFPATAAAVLVVNAALATLAAAADRMLEARLLLAGAVVVAATLLLGMARATGVI